MGKLLHRVLLIVVLSISKVHAGTFVCSKVYPPFISAYDKTDKPEKSPRLKRSYYQITRTDLVQAYSGKPVFMSNAWLTVVMMPRESLSTKNAYAELELSTTLLDKILDSSTIMDLNIRTVQTEDQLLTVVNDNPPAVGYTSLYQGRYGPSPCFP